LDAVEFGRYRLLDVIGQGGMGQVFRAHDTVMDRDVAIKVLSAEWADEPGYRERFRREALLAGGLTEPHTIRIYDANEIDGRLYLVMPIIDGVDIDAALKRDGPMSPARAVRVIEQIAAALDAAHADGLVHRDVKPANALIGDHDFVYLIDFGIAHDRAATRLTTAGETRGTAAYMAPERLTGGDFDGRADVYALACVLYECLTGQRPFPGGTDRQQTAAHLTLPPPQPSVREPAVPVGFDEVIARGMAKDPEQRYQSAGDLAAAARAALSTPLREQAARTSGRTQVATLSALAETAESLPATPQLGPHSPTDLRTPTGMPGIRPAGIGAPSFPWPPPSQPDRPPYRGWEPFQPIDAGVFFGRDAELVRAMDALRQMRQGDETLFVVLGASGAGKSCFLRAGIVPRLQKDDRSYLVLGVVRPELKALTGASGLAQAICTTRQQFGLTEPPLGDIKDACTRGDVGSLRTWLIECRDAATRQLLDTTTDDEPLTIVLPLDQAEELFAGDAGAEATGLLALVRALALGADGEEGLPLIVAATIRTDRYELMQTAQQLAGLQTEQFDLRPMDSTQFNSVITGPAQRSTDGGRPLYLDEELVRSLLADATGGADTLPLLSLTLAWLYRDYGSTGRLTLEPYAARGGIGSVVQTEIDELLSSNPEERAEQLKLLRTAFIPWLARVNPLSDEPMRRVARWKDLPEAARPLIDELVVRRLLVKDDRDGETVVEVALESLLRQWRELEAWLQEDREALKAADEIERAANAWATHDRDPSRLLSGAWLAEAESIAAAPGFRDLLAPALDFLVASRRRETAEQDEERRRQQAALETARRHAREQRRLNRRLKALLAVTGIIALVAAGGFILAFMSQQQATAKRLVSDAQAILAGTTDGSDADAFRELLKANSLSHDDKPLVDALAKRFSTVRISDAGVPVAGVAFTGQRQRLAVVTNDKRIRWWDTNSAAWRAHPLDGVQTLTSTSNLPFYFTSVAISPDGAVLASGRSDGNVELWNLDDPQPHGKTLSCQQHKGVVSALAFSRDGRIASAGGADGIIDISDLTCGQSISITTGGNVFTVAFDPRSDRLASGGADGEIRFWKPDGSPQALIPRAHPGGVMSVAFSPKGDVIASGGADHMVRLWHADSLTPVFDHPLGGHAENVESVAFNTDGTKLVSGSADRDVRMWDVNQGQPIGDPMVGHNDTVWAVAFTDDDQIVSGGSDHLIRVWNGKVGQPISAALRHDGPVTSVAVSPDGHRIASGSADKTVRLWDIETGKPIHTLTGPNGVVTSVAFSPNSGELIAAGSSDGTIWLWRPDAKEPPATLSAGEPVYSVAFSPHGDQLVSAEGNGRVTLWDLASQRPMRLPAADGAAVLAVAFSPQGDRLASAGADGMLRMWRTDSGTPVWKPRDTMAELPADIRARMGLAAQRPGVVTSIAFSPDGHYVASGSADWKPDGKAAGVIQQWDAASGQSVGDPMVLGPAAVTAVAFSPDLAGVMRIASGNSDRNVRLWDPATATQLGAPFSGHQDGVVSVAFTPDASLLVSGSADGTVRIWPVPPTQAPKDALSAKLG
jgi:WD40 repeat protein/serine/threonine protein kinase